MPYLPTVEVRNRALCLKIRSRTLCALQHFWIEHQGDPGTWQASQQDSFAKFVRRAPQLIIWALLEFEAANHDRDSFDGSIEHFHSWLSTHLLHRFRSLESFESRTVWLPDLTKSQSKQWLKWIKRLEADSATPPWGQIKRRIRKVMRHLLKQRVGKGLRSVCDLRLKHSKPWLIKLFNPAIIEDVQTPMGRTEQSLPDVKTRDMVCSLAQLIEDARRNDHDLLVAKQAALKEFAYGASHEINNPLANIAIRAQILLKQEADPQRRQRLITIEQQAMRAHEMISNLMFYANPPVPKIVELDLAALVDRVVNEMRERCEQQHTDIVVVEPMTNCMVDGDSSLLEMGVAHLIRNAMEALQEGGRILVQLVETDSGYELTVIDDGPGISEVASQHLFDPFYSGREAGRGLGFGLAMVWRILELHRGSIDWKQMTERGVCFRTSLTRSDARKSTNADAGTISTPRLHQPRIPDNSPAA